MVRAHIYRDVLFGIATADALGVPVEFTGRDRLRNNPVTGMRGYGTHRQPAGTWSDDSSLAFCLAEALTPSFQLQQVAGNFIQWLYKGFWTPHGEVFDVGITTREAIARLAAGREPQLAGGFSEQDNGNGSLMRILPLLFHTKDLSVSERFDITRSVSSITHGHIRSVMACFYYLEFARHLLYSSDKFAVYQNLQKELTGFFTDASIDNREIALFNRLLAGDISREPETAISSNGYVLHTLEAAVWCLLTTDNYPDAVLKAVNLGNDTDTTAAVTGGLAGLLYGYEAIPETWVQQLAKRAEIEDLADRLALAEDLKT